jgi:hypothetical protein
MLALLDETKVIEEQVEAIRDELKLLIQLTESGTYPAESFIARVQMMLEGGTFKLVLNNHYAERAHFRRFAKRNDRERARQQQHRMARLIDEGIPQEEPLPPPPAPSQPTLESMSAPIAEPSDLPAEQILAAGWELIDGEWLLWQGDKIVGREGDSKWRKLLAEFSTPTKSG